MGVRVTVLVGVINPSHTLTLPFNNGTCDLVEIELEQRVVVFVLFSLDE
jgi:hypothetical protein